MKKSFTKFMMALMFTTLCISLLSLNTGCKPRPTDNNTWQGDEQVDVSFGTKQVTISLKGMPISKYEDIEGVRLSDVIKKAKLTTSAKLEDYYFNFIASDDFSIATKAKDNNMSLPTWDDMQKGYLYDSGSSSGLSVKWEAGTPPGDFGKFYNCKLMDGGLIEILEDNVL